MPVETVKRISVEGDGTIEVLDPAAPGGAFELTLIDLDSVRVANFKLSDEEAEELVEAFQSFGILT
jgi:hypothetical protein